MLDEIRQLYAYNRWANHRTLEATAVLEPEAFTRDMRNSFASVRDTLVHILAAEWIWLERWRGSSPTGFPDASGLDTHEALVERWKGFEGEQAAFLHGLTESRLHEPVWYRNTADQPFSEPLWVLMRHVVNHSTYHRGQVTTLLRQLGAAPATTDMVAWWREGRGG